MSGLCAIVLAAGEGTRLRPLTSRRPKALCPVGNVALLDRALDRLAALGLTGPGDVAVNASYLAGQVVAHVGDRARLSVEPRPLGTAGGVAHLRRWIGERAVLVVNADAYWSGPAPRLLLDGWDAATVRLLGVPAGDRPAEFGPYRFAGASLLPPSVVGALPAGPGDLVRTWRTAETADRLEVVPYPGRYTDCGTPADYLAANLDAAGDDSLVAADADVTGPVTRSVGGASAVVRGSLVRSVVWPGGHVGPDEHLVDAVRVGADLTVYSDGVPPVRIAGVPR